MNDKGVKLKENETKRKKKEVARGEGNNCKSQWTTTLLKENKKKKREIAESEEAVNTKEVDSTVSKSNKKDKKKKEKYECK